MVFSYEILEKALMQAKQAREHILGKIIETIAEPRKEMKPARFHVRSS